MIRKEKDLSIDLFTDRFFFIVSDFTGWLLSKLFLVVLVTLIPPGELQVV